MQSVWQSESFMRITINPVLDMETLRWVANSGTYEYYGPMMRACSSGGQTAQTDEALQQSQAAMAQTLNQNYSTAFAEQQGVLNQQRAQLSAIAANPMGYSPQELHAATTSINENTATAAKQAMGAAAAFAAAHGGADIGSGVTGQVAGEIASGAAQSKAQQLSTLSASNEALKRSNFWSAISGLNQVGTGFGSSGSTALSGAGSAAESAVGAGKGALEAKQAGWQNVAGIIGGISGLASAGVGAYGDFLKAGQPPQTV